MFSRKVRQIATSAAKVIGAVAVAAAACQPAWSSPVSFDLVFGDRSGPQGALGSTNLAPILLGNADAIFNPNFGEFRGAPDGFPGGPVTFGDVTSVGALRNTPGSPWYARMIEGDYYRGSVVIGRFAVDLQYNLRVDPMDLSDPNDDVLLNLARRAAPLYQTDFPDFVAAYDSLIWQEFTAHVSFSFNGSAPAGFENSLAAYATRVQACGQESTVPCRGFQVFHDFEFSFSQPVDRFMIHLVEYPLPEPSGIALILAGLAGLALVRSARPKR
jgi:hypothetical protein